MSGFVLLPRRFSANRQSVSIKIFRQAPNFGRLVSKGVGTRVKRSEPMPFAFLDRHMAEHYIRIYKQLLRRDSLYSSDSLDSIPATAPKPGYLMVGD